MPTAPYTIRVAAARSHHRPLHDDAGALAGAGDVDRPEQGGANPVGQQRRGVLGDHLGVERDLRVRAVQRLSAGVCLPVDGSPGVTNAATSAIA
jgi:hypothetical protein